MYEAHAGSISVYHFILKRKSVYISPGDLYSKLTSCATCRLAGRMAIHAVKVEDFHSKQ